MPSTAPTTDTTIPLAKLPRDACATIVRIDDTAAVDRLAGLGLCVGRLVEMVQYGDPMIVRACGTRIGLARSVGTFVHVDPCHDRCAARPKGGGQ